MESIKFFKSGETKIHQGKRKVFAVKFTANKISYKTLNTFITKESKMMHEKGMIGHVYVNTFVPWRNEWRTAGKYRIGDDLFAYSEQAYEDDENQIKDKNAKYSEFILYFVKPPNAAGGTDPLQNDCLYMCILSFFGGKKTDIPKTRVNMPSKVKKFLNLERNDYIDINRLQEIADYLSVNFEVSGDYALLTKGNHTRTINVILKDGHYTLEKQVKVKVAQMSWTEKDKVMAYRCVKGKYEAYDEQKKFRARLDDDFVKETMFKPTTCPFALMKVAHEPCEEDIVEFKQMRKEIQTASKNVIDIFRFGTKHAEVAKYVFNLYQKEIIEMDPISHMESEWLNISGALMFTKESSDHSSEENNVVFEGPAKQYDTNGQYSFEMSRKVNTFPINKPEFSIVESDIYKRLKFYPYGVFRAIVTRSNTDTDKRFRFTDDNKYTHVDLDAAHQLGLEVEIIQDGQFNAMLYTKRRTGDNLFGHFVKFMINLINTKDLSDESKGYLKLVRNSLWGLLCQKKITEHHEKEDKIQTPSDFEFELIDESKGICKGYTPSSKYIHNWARIGPFLTAFARRGINKHIDPCFGKVVRLHTDGFIVSCKTKNIEIKTSLELGDLKLEHEGNVIVPKNLRKPLWN